MAGAADRHHRRAGRARSSSIPATWTGSPTPAGSSGRSRTRRLRHYTYLWLPRRDAPPRPIARPKLKLKEIQRWILREILDRIPPHDAAHGFVRGRSARTHAALHAGRHTVVRMDLEDFFAAVPAGRVYGIFRTAGYPEAVAHALTALCARPSSR